MKRIKPPVLLLIACMTLFAITGSTFFYVLHKSGLAHGTARALNGDVAWRIFDGGVDDPGANYSESTLTIANASQLTKLWKSALPATADNAIVEEPNVSTAYGLVNLVFVNTVKGNLVAFNAANGAKIWEADPSSANYNGQGTKSTPAIDPSGNYIYAYALDGFIHKYNIASGSEITGSGFPAQVTLLPNNIEKGSASINIANGYLYMTISGNDGDYGHYNGHVVAINLSSGAKTVWNAECANIAQLLGSAPGASNYCADTMSGIWARPGVKVDPVTGNVFVATGNGNYDANSGGNNWGDSIVELSPDLSHIIDSYTPASYSSLDSGDADLGSTAPVILPTQNTSNTPYMLVQAGKDHIVRLLNRANLSGQSGPRHTGGELQTITISDEVHEQPAVWVDGSGNTWVYVTDESGDLYAYKVVTSSGTSSLSQVYHVAAGVTASPFIANGVLYLDGPTILALNATTGSTLFNSSSIGISLTQHWESPVVVNGTLFTPDDSGSLYALSVANSGGNGTSASLNAGQVLRTGQRISSTNSLYSLVLQNDGNLVEYSSSGKPVWSDNTTGAMAGLVMQSDGNLVLYNTSGRAVWASSTPGNGNYLLLQPEGTLALYDQGGSTLWNGRTLQAGQYLTTTDHINTIVMQNDGNLVAYNSAGAPIWASHTSGSNNVAIVQSDGNLVIYSASGKPLWATGTTGLYASLVVQHDGNIVLYSSTGKPLWATGT